eukprot:CAMPEP_0179347454 /NCGR_PEP_ID=MMETSP0797-20121207/73144_1 /TAXON_ID=47934 /ORGANISM="Dinophysis acuminata, Strain DAEP01" /LENGTH=38 /DNA_ID= /DNA_START= /DNA_END= /DNA_ORIENTATION=
MPSISRNHALWPATHTGAKATSAGGKYTSHAGLTRAQE